MPDLVFLTCPSLQTDLFAISKNCHSFRTSNDIYIKLGPVTKLDKGNTATLKSFNDDVMSTNYVVTIIFTIYGQSGVIQNPDSERMVSKIYIFIKSKLFLSYKN